MSPAAARLVLLGLGWPVVPLLATRKAHRGGEAVAVDAEVE